VTKLVVLQGSGKANLEDIKNIRSLPSGEMIPERKVALLLWDEHNPADGVIIAVYN
jgi:hypothetical protein